MRISLKDIHDSTCHPPYRIIFYGSPGIGKTTLASEFPNPVFLQTEDSAPTGVTLKTFGVIKDLTTFYDAEAALLKEEHDFKTVVVDSLRILQNLVFEHLCNRKKIKSIEDLPYGKGYDLALSYWESFLKGMNRLRNEKNMNIIYIGHSAVTRVSNPILEPYDRFTLDLHKKLANRMQIEVDAVIFLNNTLVPPQRKQFDSFKKEKPIKNKLLDQVKMYTVENISYEAKNRYNLPEVIEYTKGHGFEVLSKYLPKEEQASEIPTAKEVQSDEPVKEEDSLFFTSEENSNENV